MSNINTNSINSNYPIAGTNNTSQGFRDNFAGIKTNLDTASTEISELQNNVLLKSPLSGITLNNDMANTVVSNMATRGFRGTSYNMGSSLPLNPDTVIVDVSQADVHFGIVVGSTSFIFAGWSPTQTLSSVELHLFIASNAPAETSISFPNTTYNSSSTVISGVTPAFRTLENSYGVVSTAGTSTAVGTTVTSFPGDYTAFFAGVTHTNFVTIPANVVELQYKISSLDCGTTIDIQPINRNRQSSVITTRTPDKYGMPGDTKGTICTDGSYIYVCKQDYDINSPDSVIWTSSSSLTDLS